MKAMKKILYIIALLFSFSMTALAQLNIRHTELFGRTLATVRYGTCTLNESHDNLYYLIIPSDNEFDNPGLFFLGKDHASALRTMADIVDLYDTLERTMSVNDALMDKVYLKKRGSSILFKFEHDLGKRWITKKEANIFLKALQEMD